MCSAWLFKTQDEEFDMGTFILLWAVSTVCSIAFLQILTEAGK